MTAMLAIAIAAGAASALMFASIISGVLTSVVLFYLASLPLMVAALGWGPLSAIIGGLVAAIGIAALLPFSLCLAYAITVALPACWLGHLAMLGRPVDNAASGNGASPVAPAMEWYPTGRLLLWITGFAVLITIATLLTLGSDAESIMAAVKRGLNRIFALRGMAVEERTIDAAAAFIPAGIALGPAITLTINLWLAGRIAAMSGRLTRPWPDLKTTALPPMTLVALCVALALCFTGGLLAMFAKVATGALLVAYGLTGFAVLHTLTLALKSRAVWLGCSYAVMIVLVWPTLSMVVLGLADAVFGFRERFMRKRPPPLTTG
jgi:hypothetical protein